MSVVKTVSFTTSSIVAPAASISALIRPNVVRV
jgi:hypothetical protein